MTHWPTQAKYVRAIVPSDSPPNTLKGARYLLNTGTAGVFIVAQDDPHADVQLYATPGIPVEVASEMLRVNLTGLEAGVVLVGYFD